MKYLRILLLGLISTGVRASEDPPPPIMVSGFEAPSTSNFVYWASMSAAERTALGWIGSGNLQPGGPALFKNGSGWGYSNVPEGTQAISLQANSAISRTIDFPVAGNYRVRWQHASRGGQVNPYVVQLDGADVSTDFSTSNPTWGSAECLFYVSEAGEHVLTFSARTNAGVDRSVAIDDVRVFSAPPVVIVTQPVALQLIVTGGTANLSVVVEEPPVASFQWYRRSPGGETETIVGATSSDFTTPELTQDTEFWVEITNDRGSVDSAVALVRVFPNTAYLADLAVSHGTLSPSFGSYNFHYCANVPFRMSSIRVIPRVAFAGTGIQVRNNGGAWISATTGTPTAELPLNVGANLIEVRLESPGLDVNTYTINVARAAEADDPVYRYDFDSDGILPNLTIYNNTGQPNSNFYTVSGGVLQQDTSTVNGNVSFLFPDVSSNGGGFSQAKATYAEARLKITSASGDSGIFLAIYDGGKSYTANFSATGVTVGSTFVPLTDIGNFHTYRLESPPNSSILYLYRDGVLTFSTTAASAPYNGFGWGDGTSSGGNHGIADWDYIEFGQLSTYTPPPSDAELAGLTLVGAELPVFDVNVSNYSVSVPNTTSNIRVVPTIAAAGMTVRVNGVAVVSGAQSSPILLNVGANVIPVVVTGMNQVTSKTYTISITRAGPVLAATGAASGLTTNGATLNGTVTPNANATVHFEYGTTAAYGMSTPPQAVSGSVEIPVSTPLSGLAADTDYHYRMVVTVSGTRVSGGHRSFTLGTPSPTTGPRVADDAVFAHDFEALIGNQITPLAGPAANKSTAILPQSTEGLPFSPAYLRFPSGSNHAKIDTGVRLESPTGELSFTIRYNGRGDNGSDNGSPPASDVRLLSTFNGGGNENTKPPDRGPYFGIETQEGLRRLVFRTQYQKFYSTVTVPAGDSVWHQAAFTLKEGILQFYFDGAPLGDPVDITGAGFVIFPAQGLNWTLGEDPEIGFIPRGANADDYFDGGFYDEAALWERALTPAEILSIHEVGLAATPRFPEPEVPGLDYNVLVKRLDFGLMEGSSPARDPQITYQGYSGFGTEEEAFEIVDGVLAVKGLLNAGSYAYNSLLGFSTNTLIIKADEGLKIEATARILSDGQGNFLNAFDGTHRYGISIYSGGMVINGETVPIANPGWTTYRMESPANSAEMRVYVNDILRYIGTAPTSTNNGFEFGVSGGVSASQDVKAEWASIELRQTDGAAEPDEPFAMLWRGAGQRWGDLEQWLNPVSMATANRPTFADHVKFDAFSDSATVYVGASQRATSMISPIGATIAGLELAAENLVLHVPHGPTDGGGNRGVSSLTVFGTTLVDNAVELSVGVIPGFYQSRNVHLKNAGTSFDATIGKIEGRLSGFGNLTILPITDPAPEQYFRTENDPYPVFNSLVIFGTHSPGGSLAHLDADYVPGVGLQTVTGPLRYAPGAVLEWDAGVGVRGVDYDAVTVEGDLTGDGAVFRVVLPGSQTFGDAFWDVARTWPDILEADNADSLDLALVFSRFEYANADGLLRGEDGAFQHGKFKFEGTTLEWEPGGYSLPPAGMELVINGGAEQGDMMGWTGAGIESVPAELVPGAGAGATHTLGGRIFKAGNLPGTSEVSQVVALPELTEIGDVSLRYGFEGMIQAREGEEGEIEVLFRDTNGAVVDSFLLTDDDTVAADWQHVSVAGELPEDAVAVEIILRARAVAGGLRRVAFDNVSLVLTTSDLFRKVDLDATVHVGGEANAVEVFLDPGTYGVRPSPFARFDAWHGWYGSGGSVGTAGDLSRGWSWGFAYQEGDAGPVRNVSSGGMAAHPGLAYPAAVNVPLEVTQAGTVRFWIPENSPEDNAGGVSLLIERVGVRSDSLAHTVGPVFYGSAADSPFRSVGFGENLFRRGPALTGTGVEVTVGAGDEFFRFDFTSPHPTHAGVVWLGGEAPNGVVAEFFDANGLLVATLGPAMMDAVRGPHFFGAVFRGGIASFTITAPGGNLVLGDLEFGIASEGADPFAEEPRFSGRPGFLNPAAVRALAVDADGTRWVGGDFSDAEDPSGGRMMAGGLAGFAADGELVEDSPVVGESVTGLAVMGGRLWVAGGADGFAMVDGEVVMPLDAGGEVVAMVVREDTLYVATRERVSAWVLDVEGVPEELANPWVANVGAEIRCLVATADGLVVGGDFSELQAEVTDGLARIDWVTGLVTPLAGGPVVAAVDSTEGLFVMVDEVDGRAVRLLAESEEWVDLEGDFVTMAVRGDSLWVADAAGGLTSYPVEGGGSNSVLDLNGVADALVVEGGNLHVLGRFNRVGEIEALGWAVVDAAGVVSPGGALGVPGEVECFARQPDGRLLVGGSFQWGSGRALGNFARLYPKDDRLDVAWRPDFTGGAVRVIAVAGDEIFVGGDFSAADGVVGSLAKYGLYEDGEPQADWSPDVARVTAIATNRDHLFVAGNFTETTALRRVVRRTGEVTADWGSELGNGGEPVEIATILLHEEYIYLGGRFASVGSTPAATRTSVARLALTDGVNDAGWNPNLFLTAEESPMVSSLLIDRGAIYLAGAFTNVQLAEQANLARMTMDADFDDGWRPVIPQPLHAMLRNGENLFVAGRDVFTVKTTAGSIQQVVETSDGAVRALDFDAGRIVAGGAFEHFNQRRDPAFAATPFLGSARVVLREGRLFVYPDDGMGPYVGSFLITALEGGRLIDPQTLAEVFSGQGISAAQGARGLMWRPDAEGEEPRVTVSPIAPGGLNAPDLSPVTTLLAEGSSVPQFSFESTWMTVYEGDLVTGFVNFTGTEEELAAVAYEVVPGSAREFNGVTGDYIGVVQPLVFELNRTRQIYQAPLRIPVLEDQQVEGPEDFFVRLVDPQSGLALGLKNLMRVSIIDGARQAGTGIPPAVLDPLRVFQPGPLPVAGSSLQVNTPPGGLWRLNGDPFWRVSGNAAVNMQGGLFHHYDLRPVDDASAPQGTRLFLAANQSKVETVTYGMAGALGTLQVDVFPFELTGGNDPAVDACWQLVGSGTWHPAGAVVPVAPGVHLIEFSSPDAEWVNPGVRPVAVVAETAKEISATYVPLRSDALTPQVLPFSAVGGPSATDGVHQYLGRIETSLGFATGTAVNEQTVLTTARVLWNADTLTVASRVAWLHQKHTGEYQPASRSPHGVFLLSGYAKEYAKDRQVGTAVNSTGNLRSDHLDVGVAYFKGASVGRGGFSGFRADFSKVAGFNPWLLAQGERVFAGYPVGGAADGRMHTMAFDAPLTHVQNQVYATDGVQGRPGMEGAPLFQQHPDGRFHPTAIYLGENRGSRFRAFDADVAELIFRSEFIAAILNFSGGTGGGDDFVNTISGDEFPIGFVQIEIPPGVGRWRAVDGQGNPVSVWYLSGEFAPVIFGNWTIQFEAVEGFVTPEPITVPVSGSGVTSKRAVIYEEVAAGGVDDLWLEDFFSLVERENPLVSGWDADPDGDGMVNLLEFAFGLHPRDAAIVRHVPGGDVAGLPAITQVEGGGLRVEFLRRTGVLDYQIQTLSPGGDWVVMDDMETVESMDDPGWERVTATLPANGLPKMFARVRVDLNTEPIDPQ